MDLGPQQTCHRSNMSLRTGVLHTIFFHRYFPSIRPSLYTPTASSTHSSSHSTQSLPIPLPAILDPPEISAAIDSQTAILVSQLTSPSPGNVPPGGSRGEIVVQFFDRKRRKTGYTGGWLGRLGGGGKTEEEVCWEEWCVQVVVARPRSEAGIAPCPYDMPTH
jgi:autophagy-related protein 101